MRARVIRRTGLAVLLAWAVTFVPAAVREPDATAAHSTGLGQVETLLDRYAQWAESYEAAGGDGNVVVPLNAIPGLTTGESRASGHATLDMVARSVTVTVDGLPRGQPMDVWLVDNMPGNGRTVAPEAGDTMVRVGTLATKDGRASLQAVLEGETPSTFEPDLVAVTPAGEPAAGPRVLAGMTTLFQRLHASKRRGEFGVLADAEETGAGHAPAGVIARVQWMLQPAAHAQIGPIPNPTTPLQHLITAGRQSFLNETFNGNGRTCATCHREAENMTITPEFIATLPPNDPLFVAEFNPALADNFENPVLMRKHGLIMENADGFGDLANRFVMRGVPHTLALLPNTLAPSNNPPGRPPAPPIDGTTMPPNERTGWSGDGAPGTGTLRDFIIGAIVQHYPRTLGRQNGVDFRLPTVAELDELEAFQKSLGRRADLNLTTLRLKNVVAERGRRIFQNGGAALAGPPFNIPPDPDPSVAAGKCFGCHANAGGGDTIEQVLLGLPGPLTNANFDTGVEDLPAHPADLEGEPRPRDGGFGGALNAQGAFGNGTFNTPVLVEAADTPPFFHNNAVNTIEGAVAFYNGAAFNQTAIGQAVGGITLDATEVEAVAAFLRVINVMENLRSSIDLEERAKAATSFAQAQELIKLSLAELEDGHQVLDAGNLHPQTQGKLVAAAAIDALALLTPSQSTRNALINQALAFKRSARTDLGN
jgi:hypothetical protein